MIEQSVGRVLHEDYSLSSCSNIPWPEAGLPWRRLGPQRLGHAFGDPLQARACQSVQLPGLSPQSPDSKDGVTRREPEGP